jgi:hypothetical protein
MHFMLICNFAKKLTTTTKVQHYLRYNYNRQQPLSVAREHLNLCVTFFYRFFLDNSMTVETDSPPQIAAETMDAKPSIEHRDTRDRSNESSRARPFLSRGRGGRGGSGGRGRGKNRSKKSYSTTSEKTDGGAVPVDDFETTNDRSDRNNAAANGVCDGDGEQNAEEVEEDLEKSASSLQRWMRRGPSSNKNLRANDDKEEGAALDKSRQPSQRWRFRENNNNNGGRGKIRPLRDGSTHIKKSNLARVFSGGSGSTSDDRIKPPKVIDSNFYHDMHMVCQTAVYKVHAPKCACQPIVQLREKANASDKHMDNRGSSGSDEHHHAVAENSSKGRNGRTSPQNKCFDPLSNSLLVIPKQKNIRVVYSCRDTSHQEFSLENQSLELEAKMLAEIMASRPSPSNNNNNNNTLAGPESEFVEDEFCVLHNLPKLEIQGAECLLAQNPNGFACIASNNLDSLARIQSWGHTTKKENIENGNILEEDHADFLGVLSRQQLWNLLMAKKKGREHLLEAQHSIFRQLSKQDIDLANEGTAEDAALQSLKIGHHLRTVLLATDGKHNIKHKNESDSSSSDNNNTNAACGMYWLVMITKCARTWELDLPGGKRHLGESTWDGLVRETLEETSLRLNGSWISEDRRNIKVRNERANMYYMLWPATLPYD